MIKVINFIIKVLLTLICIIMWWLNLLIVIIMWDGKFMIVHQLPDLIWGKPKN